MWLHIENTNYNITNYLKAYPVSDGHPFDCSKSLFNFE